MRPTAPVLVAVTTIILVFLGLPVVWMRPSGKQHTRPKDNVWILDDGTSRSFFDGISEIDKRSKPPSSFDRALSTLENSSLSHFLGLSPLTTYAQSNCNGAYNSTVSRTCSYGCGVTYPDAGNGSNSCTGLMNENLECDGDPSCNPVQGRITCDVPNCTPTPQCNSPSPSCPNPTCGSDGNWICNSPILIDPTGEGFFLTPASQGVFFDLWSNGHPHKFAWTEAGRACGWLALDRNGNGMIDNGRELFGSSTEQPPPNEHEIANGFRALAVFDQTQNGGNGDGIIDFHDAIFSRLRIWQDLNHNGISEPRELKTLSELGVSKIDLDYRQSKYVDRYGNAFYYRSPIWDAARSVSGRFAWDVFLKAVP